MALRMRRSEKREMSWRLVSCRFREAIVSGRSRRHSRPSDKGTRVGQVAVAVEWGRIRPSDRIAQFLPLRFLETIVSGSSGENGNERHGEKGCYLMTPHLRLHYMSLTQG